MSTCGPGAPWPGCCTASRAPNTLPSSGARSSGAVSSSSSSNIVWFWQKHLDVDFDLPRHGGDCQSEDRGKIESNVVFIFIPEPVTFSSFWPIWCTLSDTNYLSVIRYSSTDIFQILLWHDVRTPRPRPAHVPRAAPGAGTVPFVVSLASDQVKRVLSVGI